MRFVRVRVSYPHKKTVNNQQSLIYLNQNGSFAKNIYANVPQKHTATCPAGLDKIAVFLTTSIHTIQM